MTTEPEYAEIRLGRRQPALQREIARAKSTRGLAKNSTLEIVLRTEKQPMWFLVALRGDIEALLIALNTMNGTTKRQDTTAPMNTIVLKNNLCRLRRFVPSLFYLCGGKYSYIDAEFYVFSFHKGGETV